MPFPTLPMSKFRSIPMLRATRRWSRSNGSPIPWKPPWRACLTWSTRALFRVMAFPKSRLSSRKAQTCTSPAIWSMHGWARLRARCHQDLSLKWVQLPRGSAKSLCTQYQHCPAQFRRMANPTTRQHCAKFRTGSSSPSWRSLKGLRRSIALEATINNTT